MNEYLHGLFPLATPSKGIIPFSSPNLGSTYLLNNSLLIFQKSNYLEEYFKITMDYYSFGVW